MSRRGVVLVVRFGTAPLGTWHSQLDVLAAGEPDHSDVGTAHGIGTKSKCLELPTARRNSRSTIARCRTYWLIAMSSVGIAQVTGTYIKCYCVRSASNCWTPNVRSHCLWNQDEEADVRLACRRGPEHSQAENCLWIQAREKDMAENCSYMGLTRLDARIACLGRTKTL
jgi:hypothetical protein